MEEGNEKSFYYIDSEGQYWDEISNKLLDKEGVIAARLDEIQQIRHHNVYEKVPLSECHQNAGKSPIKVKWVDINKGDEISKEYRSRLVAKETKRDKRPICSETISGGEENAVQCSSDRRHGPSSRPKRGRNEDRSH